MYARIECYPVMEQLVVGAVILQEADTPTGVRWEPVWATRLEVPGGPTSTPQDDLWTGLTALTDLLVATVAAQR